jgi:hypothetical protein
MTLEEFKNPPALVRLFFRDFVFPRASFGGGPEGPHYDLNSGRGLKARTAI